MIEETILPMDISLEAAKSIRAGALSCMYERGSLRYIHCGNTEVIRMIYGALRNQDWETIPTEIFEENVIINDADFYIRYTALYQHESIRYRAQYTIEGYADSSIIFTMKGEALSTFKKNRIGLCVLHPIKQCIGRPAVITQPDGTSYQAVFPELVSPHQPFKQVQEMQWETENNVTVRLAFKGDIFETEDQRNWSDCSFKTYSTPLDIPFPATVQVGDMIEQVVTIKVLLPQQNSNPSAPIEIIREEKIPFPTIGFCRSKNQPPLNARVVDLLSKIRLDHYRVTLVAAEEKWMDELQYALQEAVQLNTRLELVIFFSDDVEKELGLLISVLKVCQHLIKSLLVLSKEQQVSPNHLLQNVYPKIKKEMPSVPVGYGTDGYFVDLNRQRPGQSPFDFLSFTVQPQVHALDSRSVLENLESHPYLIKTAMAFAHSKPVYISPVTFAGRNHSAGSVDERQLSWFAAMWTLLAILGCGLSASISCNELVGAAGLLQVTPEQNGEPECIVQSPIYKVLTTLHSFSPRYIIKKFSGDDLLMDGLLVENKMGERLFFKVPDQILNFKNDLV